MPPPRPDLDARGYPVSLPAQLDPSQFYYGLGGVSITLPIPEQLHVEFRRAAKLHGVSANEILKQLYFAACQELDIDVEPYEAFSNSRYRDLRKSAMHELPFNSVVIDECDLPGVVESLPLEDIDPYETSYVINDELSDISESLRMRKLRGAINDATTAIEKITSMKAYTSVFKDGRITKEEAKAELQAVLDLMPDQVGEALWGWCSLNDALLLIRRWKRQVLKQLKVQLQVEQARLAAEERKAFMDSQEAKIELQKQTLLESSRRQRRVRPRHGYKWPSWAGEMESYLDFAASPDNYDPNTDYLRQVYDARLRRTSKGPYHEHQKQTTCSTDLRKGFNHETD